MEYELTGFEDLEANVTKLIAALDKTEVAKILETPAKMLEDDIRARAPQGPTGNLKRSIMSKVYDDYAAAVAIIGINYGITHVAHLVEFGHGGPHPAPAHPFFRPAWDANKTQIVASVKQGLIDAVDQAVG
jgi:HK97 gp10 family phage protein